MIELLKQHPVPIVYGFWLRFFSAYGQTYFVALFSLWVENQFELNAFYFGGLYSLATLLSAFVLMGFGPFSDRISIHRLGWIGIVGISSSCLIMGLSPNWMVLGIGLLGLRFFSIGLLLHTSVLYLSSRFLRSRGKALALSGLGHTMGEAFFPWVIIILMERFSPETTWITLAIIVLIVLGGTHWRLRPIQLKSLLPDEDTFIESKSRLQKDWTREEVIKDINFWLLLPGTLAPALVLTGMFFHIKAFFLQADWALTELAWCMTLFAIARLFCSLIMGPLIDRFTALNLLPLYLSPLLFGFLSLILIPEILGMQLFMFFCGACVGFSTSMVPAFLAESYGLQHLGAIRSLSSAMAVIATSITPVLMGWFISKSYGLAFLSQCCIVYTALAMLLNLRSYFGYKRRLL
ncbi:MAG: MFS transporter [Candidatus Cloacimonetes bacterium]|nr:MFS transporter [Candidatus Cloacimonadota bacterium]